MLYSYRILKYINNNNNNNYYYRNIINKQLNNHN